MAHKPSDSQVDERKIDEMNQGLVRAIIHEIGDDVTREGVIDTPRRVVKSWKEIYSGYGKDPKKVLGTTFDAGNYSQIVICKNIEFFSTCEHHMLPFFGKVSIGYFPGRRVVGLSKMARLVEVFSRRLQIQEQMTQQIADTLMNTLKAKGVMVVVEAKHFCMVARGVHKQNSSMVTSAVLGNFKDVAKRAEFMELIK